MALTDEVLNQFIIKDETKEPTRRNFYVENTAGCQKSIIASTEQSSAGSWESQRSKLVSCHFHLLKSMLERVVAQHTPPRLSFPVRNQGGDLPREKPVGSCEAKIGDEITEVVEMSTSKVASWALSDDGSEASLSETNKDHVACSALDSTVQRQLHMFIERIASRYSPKNQFHNFIHASHVAFSSYQLVRKVAVPDLPPIWTVKGSASDGWKTLPESLSDCIAVEAFAEDALAQFAVVFSALVHDVDHTGIPNTLLAKESPTIAEKYDHRSIAEQTSLDVAFGILAEDSFSDLRNCIFPSSAEYNRFRAIVVNLVMATDVFDETIRDFQVMKWTKAFRNPPDGSTDGQRNRRATVLMDLIMICSDVSHTMQSFGVYCEWNERLYRELHAAYRDGRSDVDPSDAWVMGELTFFDEHVIPLVQRLQDSGMFGATADTMMDNARRNRTEWERHGKKILADYRVRVRTLPTDDDQGPSTKKTKLNKYA